MDNFDDFARRRDKELQNRERLAKETKPEWEVLKGLASRFAIDAQGIDSYKFKWVSDLSGHPMMVLNDVSAILFDGGERDGVPQDCRVLFSRRPAGSGQAYPDESPVPEKTWSLKAEIVDDTNVFPGHQDQLVWFVNERGRRMPSAELAEEIAKELARYHIEYEKEYGRAS
jgi:hypothetical protein